MGELTLEERGQKIVDACLAEKSASPYEVFRNVAHRDFVRMHGPEHHVLDGAAVLTAYRNAGGNVDLPAALNELMSRGLADARCHVRTLGRVRRHGICGSCTLNTGVNRPAHDRRLLGQPHGLHVPRARGTFAHRRAALLQARRVHLAGDRRRLHPRALWRAP